MQNNLGKNIYIHILLLSRVWLFETHGLQHTRVPCPLLSPRVCSDLCPLNWWYYLTISSSVTLFSCPPSFPASGSFPMSQLFTSGDQSIGTLAYFQWNIQSWFPLGLTGIISLESKGLSRVFSSNTVWKHQFISAQSSLWFNSQIHYMTTRKTIALTIWTFVGKVMPLFINILSRFVITSLPKAITLGFFNL